MSLHGAIKQQGDFVKLTLKEGTYRAQFLGMGEPYMAHGFDGCPKCGPEIEREGRKTNEKGPGCEFCDRSGRKPEQKIQLKYLMTKSGETEVEELGYKLSPPGNGKGGRVLSPSKLYTRLRSFSGLTDPNEQASWYDTFAAAGEPLPVMLTVGLNQSGTATKIQNVTRLEEDA